MKRILLAAALIPFTVTAAMTEKECENQAKAIYSLAEMIEDGSLQVNEKYLEKLAKADEHYKKGEYCAARSIVLTLDK